MELKVIRDRFTPLSTGGVLYIDGVQECYTLEPPKLDPPAKPRAIPVGCYAVTLRFSPKHNRNVPHVEDVPDFEAIEIHIGNYPHDTEGCLLVGSGRGTDSVISSTPAFEALYSKLQTADAITIEYTEG